MKHLLIILSFLLLSSPVIGDNHKGETLYRWKNTSGIGYVWKGYGNKDTHRKYQGDVKNGKPNGLGFLIYPNGWKYMGSWKNGEHNGQGTYSHTDGRKYVGEYEEGIRKNGTSYDKDGNIIGKYVNGKYIKQ